MLRVFDLFIDARTEHRELGSLYERPVAVRITLSDDFATYRIACHYRLTGFKSLQKAVMTASWRYATLADGRLALVTFEEDRPKRAHPFVEGRDALNELVIRGASLPEDPVYKPNFTASVGFLSRRWSDEKELLRTLLMPAD